MKNKSINIITWGGLGDALLATPAIKALKKNNPAKKIKVFYLKRHRDIFLNNPYIDVLKEASFLSAPVEWILAYFNLIEFKSFNYSYLSPAKNYSKSIVEVIAEMLDVELDDTQMDLFLTDDEINGGREQIAAYANPITINPYAVCSKHKEWSTEKWEKLIEDMPGYTFIQLGLNKEPLLKGAVDLRGKSLRQSAAILKSSTCYVGVDSFLAHAAAALNTAGIVLFGASSSIVFGHKSNININERLACSPCIEFIMKSVCPYNRECMHKITVEDVKNAIIKQTRDFPAEDSSIAIEEYVVHNA
ncbi:glycosyltransferase family 9 protein [soil metagenome]|jgi:ADP-heptose:LPS heptosyltransferase